MKEKIYVKAIQHNKVVMLELKRATKTTFAIYYANDKELRDEYTDKWLGEWYNGGGNDIEFYGATDINGAMENMKINWEYTNVKLITKEEFDNFKATEDYRFIKWGKSVTKQ